MPYHGYHNPISNTYWDGEKHRWVTAKEWGRTASPPSSSPSKTDTVSTRHSDASLSDIHEKLAAEGLLGSSTGTAGIGKNDPVPTSGEAGGSQSHEHVFASGAKRSGVMPFYSAIPPLSLRRVALRATGAPRGEVLSDDLTGHTYEGGSRKYGYGNWERGLPMEDTLDHIIEHLNNWRNSIQQGVVPKDDDLAAVAWGVLMPLMTFERTYAEQFNIRNKMLRVGKTAEEIDRVLQEVDTVGDTEPFMPCLLRPLSPDKPNSK